MGNRASVGIGKIRAQPHRAGGLVDLVIHGDQRPGGQLVRLIAVPCVHRQFLAGAKTRENQRKLVFGNGEDHADGLDLRDHQQAVGVGGVHDVAGVHQPQTDAAGDGRGDVTVDQVELGAVDLPLIGFDDAFILRHQRLLRGVLLLGNGVLLEQRFVAAEIHLGVREQRLVADAGRLRPARAAPGRGADRFRPAARPACTMSPSL